MTLYYWKTLQRDLTLMSEFKSVLFEIALASKVLFLIFF